MAKENIVVGLDVGTTKVAVTVGQAVEGLIKIIGFSKTPNAGMRRGAVVDIEDTVSAISLALEDAERMAGTNITSAFVSLGGSNITSTTSKGVVAVSRADGEITRSDIQRVIEAAKTVALPPNKEIIHCIPKSFAVDAQKGILDPTGMSGIRLEAETIVIGAATSAVSGLTKCLHQAGVNIDGLVFNGLASSRALLNKRQKEMGVLLVDLGGGTTSIAVFDEGELSHAAVIPVGSMHVTNDIAIGLRTSLESAEKIKINYGSAIPSTISEQEKINMSTIDPQDNQRIQRRYLAEIIHARSMEILNLIREELKKIGKDGLLPAGVVLTGGGSKMEDLVELAKEELRLPVEIGLPVVEIDGLIDKMTDGVYSTSVGLILYGLENPTQAVRISSDKIVDKARSFLKQFLP